ncbi:Peptidase S53 propeptide [Catenulispora acidiphila DSM 44928]|uniref:Peptidase S53 propeptide n=1 Tax=Catenulispora acidiphila (strain DSM 44928 / JCM 14897 / NBRC 102108 / NRRL B-24433 / ID139908) TaxID=479433 RepID=C7Q2F1_CATAD|nr:protease pro-enzyme activation domain-containing protein [Catenulispora acidiphila]ACU69793.1 Peptidase S53 propeptide [Catenulispora acidiphila DSM 44928]
MAVALLAAGTADAAVGAPAGPQERGGPVSVRIGLAGRDPVGLEAFARAVSTPGDAQYGRYLTPAQAQARFGATDAQVAKVQKWLRASGMRVTNQDPHWIDATGSAGAVQKAFGAGTRTLSAPPDVARAVANVARLGQTQVQGMREGASAAITARRGMSAHPIGAGALGGAATGNRMADGTVAAVHSIGGMHLPADVPEHPDVVHSTGATPQARAALPSCSPTWGALTADPTLPAGYTTPEPIDVCGYVPSQLRTAYGVAASGLNGSGVTVAVIDAYGSPTMLTDANRFAQAHGDQPFAGNQYQETVTASQWTHTTDGVCQSPGDWAGEEALDVETVHGMAPGATVHYFGANSCADQDINATMANIVDNHLADIVSSSFGETMHRASGSIDPALISQATQLFQYAASEGIGLYFATGDCGDDSNRTGPGCDPESARAQTEWPVSSPWVTGVGGTALALGVGARPLWQTSMGDRRSELSADGRSWVPFPGDFYFGGGGGTSEDFQQPAYQQGIVPDALARTLGTGAKAAGPMRTLPDVAMDGDLLTAVQVGVTDATSGQYSEIAVGGTSAATPMFAATQADGQQAQAAAGGKAIGFANPDLYKRATSSTFTDVVAQPAGAPSPISTVLDLGADAQGTRQVRLFELGHDQGLAAASGYDVATGLGSPREEYLNSFKN